MQPQSFALENIAIIHTPFKQKFAIPRQPRLVPEAIATLQLLPPYNSAETVRGLEQFSHLWLLFLFHENLDKGWSPTIRPPRLGGNKKVGVFASRSTFRPNGIGMSAVELLDIKTTDQGPELILGGVDLLDKTPIIDIKPYIPYSDIIETADGGYAEDSPDTYMQVEFSEQALSACQQASAQYPHLLVLIEKLLKQDPRPAYKKHKPDDKVYNVELYEFDVSWQVMGDLTRVLAVNSLV